MWFWICSYVLSECMKSDLALLSWCDHFCHLLLTLKRPSWFLSLHGSFMVPQRWFAAEVNSWQIFSLHSTSPISPCPHLCKSLQACLNPCYPRTVAHQALPSTRFSRQESWCGLLCCPTGDLSDPGIEPASLTSPTLAGTFFTTSCIWEAFHSSLVIIYLRLISSDNGREIRWKIFISKYLNKFLFISKCKVCK